MAVSIEADATRPLKILIFYQTIYPDYFGGIELRNFELAKALVARGHQVTLTGFSDTAISTPPAAWRRAISTGFLRHARPWDFAIFIFVGM